jgi:hypothetical protein
VTEDFCDARDWLAWGTQHHNAGAEAASSLFCHHRRAPLFPTCCSSTGVGDIVRQTTRTTDCSTVMPGSPLVDVKESLTRSACSSPFSANMFPACGFPEGAAKRRDPRAVRLRGRRPGAPTDGERGGAASAGHPCLPDWLEVAPGCWPLPRPAAVWRWPCFRCPPSGPPSELDTIRAEPGCLREASPLLRPDPRTSRACRAAAPEIDEDSRCAGGPLTSAYGGVGVPPRKGQGLSSPPRGGSGDPPARGNRRSPEQIEVQGDTYQTELGMVSSSPPTNG